MALIYFVVGSFKGSRWDIKAYADRQQAWDFVHMLNDASINIVEAKQQLTRWKAVDRREEDHLAHWTSTHADNARLLREHDPHLINYPKIVPPTYSVRSIELLTPGSRTARHFYTGRRALQVE